MRYQELADRFRPDYPINEPDIYVLRDEQGRMEAHSDCPKECMTWASTAQIKAGDIRCPNGHPTKVWGS